MEFGFLKILKGFVDFTEHAMAFEIIGVDIQGFLQGLLGFFKQVLDGFLEISRKHPLSKGADFPGIGLGVFWIGIDGLVKHLQSLHNPFLGKFVVILLTP